MAGLLDDALSFIKTPEGIGLLSAAFGGAAGARRGTPWNNMGRAGVAGLTGYAQAQDQQVQLAQADEAKKLRELQMKQLQQQMADAESVRNFQKGIGQYIQTPAQQALAGGGGPTIENAAKIPTLKPQIDLPGMAMGMAGTPGMADEAIKILTQKPERVIVPAGATVWEGGKAAFTSPFKEGAPSNLSKLIAERDALPPDSPALAAYNNAIRKESETAKQISPTIVVGGDEKYAPVSVVKRGPDGKDDPSLGTELISRSQAIKEKRTLGGSDPTIQGSLSSARSEGREVGEGAGKAKLALPGAQKLKEATFAYIDKMLAHPGFESYVGATLRPFASMVDGSPEADFKSKLDQLEGGAFLEAYTMLKGGGAITEIEGIKATNALNRMKKSTSEAEFQLAAQDYKDAITRGFEKLEAQSRMGSRSPNKPTGQGVDASNPLLR